MKIIETEIYKLAKKAAFEGAVLTPENEDAFVEQEGQTFRNRRRLLGPPDNKNKGRLNKRDFQKGLSETNTNMTDDEWRKFIQQKIREQQRDNDSLSF